MMRIVKMSLLASLLLSASAYAGGISYDRIPSDATGYMHVDFERVVGSNILGAMMSGASNANQSIISTVGMHADGSMYTEKLGDTTGIVVLIHAPDSPISKWMATDRVAAVGDFRVTYRNQEIIYTTAGFSSGLMPQSKLLSESMAAPSTRPGVKTPATNKSTGNVTDSHTGSFFVGFGPENSSQFGRFLDKGPCYTAFIKPDLIVISGDLPLITGEIDVLQGIKPSLAKLDPQEMKMNAPDGAMIMGVGLTAGFSTNSNDKNSTDESAHAEATVKTTNGSGMDLFGSLKAKAHLAQFDMGENENELYLDGVFTMDDAESAQQLNNLVAGVKALLFLSQPQYKPILNPLRIGAKDKEVSMRWSWQTAKLPDLLRLIQQINTTSK